MSDQVVIVDAHSGPELDLVAEGGSARAVVWPGMGAQLRSMHRISLEPGGRTRPVSHPGEAVFYVISGTGRVDDSTAGMSEQLVEGSMVHVEPGTAYALVAGEEGIEIVGGPSPVDPALYRQPGPG